MPEGDTIFRAARALNRALAGSIVREFDSVFPRLTRVNEDTPIVGRTVLGVESRGKWILMNFSGDLTLVTHMLMNGSWHIYRRGERWRRRRQDMRVAISTDEFTVVAFTIQVAEFHTAESLKRREGLRQLGPDVLAEEFNPSEVAASLRTAPELEVGEALLRQSLLAGVGNVFKSEICFECRVNPFKPVRELSVSELACLVQAARRQLLANVIDPAESTPTYSGMRRTTGRANPDERLWVYGRGAEPCRVCGTAIERRKQGPSARVTFWCPRCQPLG